MLVGLRIFNPFGSDPCTLLVPVINQATQVTTLVVSVVGMFNMTGARRMSIGEIIDAIVEMCAGRGSDMDPLLP